MTLQKYVVLRIYSTAGSDNFFAQHAKKGVPEMSQAKLNFSRAEFEQRLLKIRQEMQRRGVDLLIVSYWSIMNW